MIQFLYFFGLFLGLFVCAKAEYKWQWIKRDLYSGLVHRRYKYFGNYSMLVPYTIYRVEQYILIGDNMSVQDYDFLLACDSYRIEGNGKYSFTPSLTVGARSHINVRIVSPFAIPVPIVLLTDNA